MKEGLKRAVEILDGLQDKYREKLHSAIMADNKPLQVHWQAYLGALTTAARLIEEELEK